jgi:VWFA-related protein
MRRLLAGSLLGIALTAQEAAPTFRSNVSEVALDLVVRDAHGRIVGNLQPTDVEIYENGVRQELRSLRLVPGREVEKQMIAAGGAKPPLTPLHAVNLVCIVFHDLNNATRRFTLEAAREFVKHPLSPDTYVGVFSLDSGLRPLLAFTNNRDELARASEHAFVGAPVDFASAAATVLNASPGAVSAGSGLFSSGVNTLAVTAADVNTGQGADAIRGDLAQTRRQFIGLEGAKAMDQIKNMVQMLAQLPGRKTVLLLSPGLTTTGDPDRFKAMIDTANRAAITVYAIDTNGMTENSSTLAAGSLMGTGPGVSMESVHADDYRYDAVRTSNPQAPLRALAEGTGGFLSANTNDLRKSFDRIADDANTHYEAVYRPSDDKFDGRFRRVEVKLVRADLTVASRAGYFALPDAGGAPPALFETAALTALGSGLKTSTIEFRSAAYQFQLEGSETRDVLAFEVSAAGLTTTPLPPARKQRLHISLLALVKDASGQVVDKISQDFPFEFPDDQMAAVHADSIRYHRAVKLLPGHYSMETAVVDRQSNRTTTGSIQFDVAAHSGLAVSDIALVQSLSPLTAQAEKTDPFQFENKLVSPELNTSLRAGARPYIYFVVYPDKANADKPKIRIEVFNDGQPLASQSSDLPSEDAAGAVPLLVGAPTKPGKCKLMITATQGGQSVERSLTYFVPN